MTPLKKITSGKRLTLSESSNLMNKIRNGKLASEQISALLCVMNFRGESSSEIAGFVQAVTEDLERPFEFEGDLLDVCGTGGDGSNTFNISTTVALLLSAYGIPVAKHGNVSVSSQSGSANLVEALGFRLERDCNSLSSQLHQFNFAFFFAPYFHQAFKNVAPIRASLKVKTIFNLLGPLVNPMRPTHQVIGVYSPKLIRPIADAIAALGRKRALVVSSESGMDEFTLHEKSHYALIEDRTVTYHTFNPAQLKLAPSSLKDIEGGDACFNAKITVDVLNGSLGPTANIVNLNAAAALVAFGKHTSILTAFRAIQEFQRSGNAFTHLQKLIGTHHAAFNN